MDASGAALLDRGAPVGGSEWVIQWQGPEGRDLVRAMVESYPLIRVSTSTGVYHAAPARIEDQGRMVTLTVIVKEQMA